MKPTADSLKIRSWLQFHLQTYFSQFMQLSQKPPRISYLSIHRQFSQFMQLFTKPTSDFLLATDPFHQLVKFEHWSHLANEEKNVRSLHLHASTLTSSWNRMVFWGFWGRWDCIGRKAWAMQWKEVRKGSRAIKALIRVLVSHEFLRVFCFFISFLLLQFYFFGRS